MEWALRGFELYTLMPPVAIEVDASMQQFQKSRALNLILKAIAVRPTTFEVLELKRSSHDR